MNTTLTRGGHTAGAVFSHCQRYRYSLWRRGLNPNARMALWIMLNPSTADEHVLDPTVTRCQSYTRAWGFGEMEVANLFALRSTDPKAMLSHPAPIGPENDAAIILAAVRADLIICAWGNHGAHLDRAAAVVRMLGERGLRLHCLTTTKTGEPGHPLYLRHTLTPVDYSR